MATNDHLRAPLAVRLTAAGSALILALGLGWALHALPPAADGLAQPVADNLGAAGVGNPVTAVLLNFRAYDTLLEVAVLVLAIVGAQALRGHGEGAWTPRPHGPVLGGLLRMLAPLIIIFAGYLLWTGGDQPGGAFQAGAMLASAGVVLFLAGLTPPTQWKNWMERCVVIMGLCVFALAALLCVLLGGSILQYPAGNAKLWILVIEAVSALSIALVLVLLCAGGPMGHQLEDDD